MDSQWLDVLKKSTTKPCCVHVSQVLRWAFSATTWTDCTIGGARPSETAQQPLRPMAGDAARVALYRPRCASR